VGNQVTNLPPGVLRNQLDLLENIIQTLERKMKDQISKIYEEELFTSELQIELESKTSELNQANLDSNRNQSEQENLSYLKSQILELETKLSRSTKKLVDLQSRQRREVLMPPSSQMDAIEIKKFM